MVRFTAGALALLALTLPACIVAKSSGYIKPARCTADDPAAFCPICHTDIVSEDCHVEGPYTLISVKYDGVSAHLPGHECDRPIAVQRCLFDYCRITGGGGGGPGGPPGRRLTPTSEAACAIFKGSYPTLEEARDANISQDTFSKNKDGLWREPLQFCCHCRPGECGTPTPPQGVVP